MGEGPSSERSSGEPRTPLEALAVLAAQEVDVTPALRHLELFTMGGLLTLLWHHPPDTGDDLPADRRPGRLPSSPAAGRWAGCSARPRACTTASASTCAAQGVPLLRVSYRRPNDLDACCLDVAAAVQLVTDARGAARSW